jgi:hypothetical protein
MSKIINWVELFTFRDKELSEGEKSLRNIDIWAAMM